LSPAFKGILQLNLLATDFYHDKAYPSFLYYNPYTTNKTVSMKTTAGKKVDLYKTVSGKFIACNISAAAQIKLPPQSAAVFVCVPAAGKVAYEGKKMLVNGVVVDYMFH
jgi:hypothetical protein